MDIWQLIRVNMVKSIDLKQLKLVAVCIFLNRSFPVKRTTVQCNLAITYIEIYTRCDAFVANMESLCGFEATKMGWGIHLCTNTIIIVSIQSTDWDTKSQSIKYH